MQISIRQGAAVPQQELSAKRLQLTGVRFAVLVSAAPAPLPPPFADLVASIVVADEAAVWGELETIGVAARTAAGAFEPVPAVATTLRLLTSSPFALQLLAGTSERGVAAWWALDGQRGAGLRLLPGSAVEVSAFLARQWRAEVTRAVPPADVFTAGSGSGSVAAGLGGLDHSGRPSVGETAHRLVFDDLAVLLDSPEAVPTGQPVDPQLAAAISHPAARLQSTVFARTGDGTASGSVTWAAAPGGWLAIRLNGRSDRGGRARMVDVVPVQPADLAAELAPLLVAGATTLADGDSQADTDRDSSASSAPNQAGPVQNDRADPPEPGSAQT